MRALILPKYARRAASTRYRFLQYLPALQEAGIDCDVTPLFDDEYLAERFATGRTHFPAVLSGYLRRVVTLMRNRRYDVLVVYFELLPYLPRWVERVFAPSGIPYVLDLDDAVFLQYEEVGRVVRWLCGDKMTHVFADATLVMAGNEFLANRARQHARWVEVVPTVVDTQRYLPGLRGGRDGFTIGWIGSPSTARYLQPVAGSLGQICAEGGARVVVVGAGTASLPDIRAEAREWSEETEIEAIREFDVGIMPLPDTAWARGKCGFKLIQYMACGIPVVASPVGVNVALVEHGVNGFLATTAEDWIAALARLRDDPALRRQMGDAGRTKIEHHYSLRALAPRVSSLIQQAADSRTQARPGNRC